jgi:hypothetical protein
MGLRMLLVFLMLGTLFLFRWAARPAVFLY